MRQKLRANRELFALIGLFMLFLFGVYHYKQAGNEAMPRTAPSSLNTRAPGAKALFLLLTQLGYRADRLESGWRTLTADDGLVIVIEPLLRERAPTQDEVAALRSWIQRGGTALYLVTTPARALDPNDPLAGDIAIIPGSPAQETLPVTAGNSPYLRDVAEISMACPVRLKAAPNSGYDTLLQDSSGEILLHKQIGKGHLIVAADLDLTSNSAISNADNAELMVNVAAVSVGSSGKTVQFDEYHHGAGFEGNDEARSDSLWFNTPAPIRLTLLHLFALTALLVYNGNRRFGKARTIAPLTARAGTDYVSSMARLYRRSQSADIAIQNLAVGFRRDLTRRLAIAPDADSNQIITLVQRRYNLDAQPLGTLLQRLAQIDAGATISETEMMARAAELDAWRRRLELVGA